MDNHYNKMFDAANKWINEAVDFIYITTDSEGGLFLVIFMGMIVIIWLIMRKPSRD